MKFLNFSTFLPFIIGGIFASFNFYLISRGHFLEDAYILFIYVENIINGNGIAYFPGGVPTEGATDFLWLMLLVVLGKLGINTGSSVIFLNAIGVSIIVFWIQRAISKSKAYYFFLFPFLFLWLIQDLLQAAVGGFSVYLYLALILSAFIILSEEKHLKYLPYLSILIALFRPDGVIIGIGFTLLGAYKARQQKQTNYYIHMLITLFIGLVYFVWRFQYFGNLLPLPLYVKGSSTQFAPGFKHNLYWFLTHLILILPTSILGYFSKKKVHYFFGALPILILFIALFAATQSQNIGFRFQAPLLIVVYYILICLLVELLPHQNYPTPIKKILLIAYICLWIGTGTQAIYNAFEITKFNYFNQIPLAINKILPKGSTILLTEAGRLAYWNQKGNHKILDLVGLNSEYPAKHTISSTFLEEKNPDLIMFHQGHMLDIDWLKNSSSPVIWLKDKHQQKIKSHYKLVAQDRRHLRKTFNASYISISFLKTYFDEFDIFIVDYHEDKSYIHVFAIAKYLKLSKQLNSILLKSFNRNTARSYYEMLKERKEIH